MFQKNPEAANRTAMTELLEGRVLLSASASPAADPSPAAVVPGTIILGTTVTTSTLPEAVVAGGVSRGHVIVDVSNAGSLLDSGSFVIDVFASPDGLVDGSATLIASLSHGLKVRSGGTAAVVVPIKSVPATLNGQYSLLSKVTDAGGNTAASTTGPALSAAAPFVQFSESLIRTTLAPSNISGQKTRASVILKITNNGNVISGGESAVAFYASPDGSVINGTLIRSVSERIKLKVGGSRLIAVPLLSLPAVADGSYQLVSRITDSGGNVTDQSLGTYTLASPFVSLVPSAASVLIARNGTATVSFSVTNNGNISSAGVSNVAVLASANGTAADATAIYSKPTGLPVLPGRSRVVRLRLTAAEVTTLQSAVAAILQITDPLGGVQTLTLSGI